jgi:predicted RNA-binding protein YlqC (UPF0109 family)
MSDPTNKRTIDTIESDDRTGKRIAGLPPLPNSGPVVTAELNGDNSAFTGSNAAALISAALPASARQPDGLEDICLKILINDKVSGAIIGRAGSTISELQSTYSGTVKVSRNDNVYPATGERVVLASAPGDNGELLIENVIYRIFDSLEQNKMNGAGASSGVDHLGNPLPPQAGDVLTLRILVPSGSAGVIIGRGGAKITAMKKSSGCEIKITDPKVQSDLEKVITLIGSTRDSIVSAAQQIARALVTDSNGRYQNLKLEYRAVMPLAPYGAPQMGMQNSQMFGGLPGAGMGGMGGGGGMPPFPSNPLPSQAPANLDSVLNVAVPNNMCGAILGRSGANVKAVMGSTSTSIKVSQRDQLNPGADRTLIISGASPNATNLAYNAIRGIVIQQTGQDMGPPGTPPALMGQQVQQPMQQQQ